MPHFTLSNGQYVDNATSSKGSIHILSVSKAQILQYKIFCCMKMPYKYYDKNVLKVLKIKVLNAENGPSGCYTGKCKDLCLISDNDV